jgi:hypothetical protein
MAFHLGAIHLGQNVAMPSAFTSCLFDGTAKTLEHNTAAL